MMKGGDRRRKTEDGGRQIQISKISMFKTTPRINLGAKYNDKSAINCGPKFQCSKQPPG
jgi:hypothetical protein